MGADDLVIRSVDEDFDGGGGLADPVGGVPVAGVGVADGQVDPVVACLGFEHADTDELGDGENGGRDPGVVRGGGGVLDHVGGGDLGF